jgi:RNA polymerase sigma factor for flagellar operon FliA
MAALQKKLGRVPAEDEIAEQLGLSLEEYFKLLDEARCVPLISTEDLPPDYLERYSREDIMEEISAGNPLSLLVNIEKKNNLKNAIDQLPEKERLFLSLYYYEALTMKEAGRVMDLTESRVCQLHAQAVLHLRSMINSAGN